VGFVSKVSRAFRTCRYVPRRVSRFNPDFYRRHYPDLRRLDDVALWAHWRSTGWREGRIQSWSELRRAFRRRGLSPRKVDYLAYLALNGDLVRSGYETLSQSAAHYLRMGRKESRATGFELPSDYVALLNANRVEETWPFVPTQAGDTPRWDTGAMSEFTSQLEEQWMCTSGDEFLIKTCLHFAGHTPRGLDLDRFGSTIEYGTPRSVPFAFIASHYLVHVSALARNELVSPSVDDHRERATPTEVALMGMPVMTSAEWYERAVRAVEDHGVNSFPPVATSPRPVGPTSPGSSFDVAVLCSIYRPGVHLSTFLGNLDEQTIFDRTEIILLAVELTPDELREVNDFAKTRPNVVVAEFSTRIGIYEAWNRGVELSTAPLLTNMNVDDLRRNDSLEVQRDTLKRFPWVDVVFQDVQLMLSRELAWPVIDDIGATTRLPQSGIKSLASGLNPPHNGPMWRRALHDVLGGFREDLTSVSDWDFWVRAAEAGKRFMGTSDAHVGYFINPEGVSTSSDGVARSEHRQLLRDYVHLLNVPGPTGDEIRPHIRATPISRADRYSAGMIDVLTALRREAKT
jgi:hypothetical protein